MNIKSLLLIVFSLLIAAPAMTIAGPIYNVSRTIGPGSVTGTIETDGTIGVLAGANVIGWSLTIDDGDGNGPFMLVNPGNSGLLVSGNLLSATVNDILFSFTGGTGFALFQNPNIGSGQNWWCVEGVNSNCAGSGNNSESVNRFGSPAFVNLQGVVSIATRGNVPEPASIALLGIGLAGLGAMRRRKTS